MRKREFARALRHGLGAAYLHVKEYGDSGVEKHLLNACLKDLVYDGQIDSGRAGWLARMLDRTGRIEKYAEAIHAALTAESSGEEWDLEQLVQLACELFERGFGEFKDVLLGLAQDKQDSIGQITLGEALIDVAGLTGFAVAADKMVRTGADNWEKHSLYEYACRSCGNAEEVDTFIGSQFWSDVQVEIADRQQPVATSSREPLSLAQVLDVIENGEKPEREHYRCRVFGRTATDEELLIVADRLEKEKDPLRLYAYLAVFWNRPLPVASPKVIRHLFSENADIRRSARNALSMVRSSAVRKAALKALKSDTEDLIVSGLNLLKLNYQKNDLGILTSGLGRLENVNQIHWGARAATGIAERSNDVALSGVLAWVYEYTPCGLCRGGALNRLIQWGTAPAQVLYEAQWDAEEDTRRMARAVLKASS
ncbi:MAG: hypothetical protein AB7W16_14280 [Candidatus Obscuribacterales bacterium]